MPVTLEYKVLSMVIKRHGKYTEFAMWVMI